MQPDPRKRTGLATVCFATGLFLLLFAADVIPGFALQENDAPAPIVALSGLIFVIAGSMVLSGNKNRINNLLAALLCTTFGVIGAWVALGASDRGFSGGIPFVSSDTNVRLARVMFGIGSAMCFAIAGWAFARFIGWRGDSN